MAAAFIEFTNVQQHSVMPFVDFEGVKANEIYDGSLMNGVKHLDASSGWGLRVTCVWVKTCRLSNSVIDTPRTTAETEKNENLPWKERVRDGKHFFLEESGYAYVF